MTQNIHVTDASIKEIETAALAQGMKKTHVVSNNVQWEATQDGETMKIRTAVDNGERIYCVGFKPESGSLFEMGHHWFIVPANYVPSMPESNIAFEDES